MIAFFSPTSLSSSVPVRYFFFKKGDIKYITITSSSIMKKTNDLKRTLLLGFMGLQETDLLCHTELNTDTIY